MLITRFHRDDPKSNDVLPEIPKEILLNHILSIHPSPPISGRSIKLSNSSNWSYFDPKEHPYIVLKPANHPLKEEWPVALPDFVNNEEMSYIKDMLLSILMQESIKSNMIQNNAEKDDEDGKSASAHSSSSTSSFPKPRLCINLERVDHNKSIEEWVLASSPKYIIDMNDKLR